MVGCNSRLDTIQAAILDIKLSHLDEYAIARRSVADFYDKTFAGNPAITVPYRAPWSRHVFHQYTLVLEGVDRDTLSAHLADKGIPSMIYYPVPGHRQKMFAQTDSPIADMPLTDWLTSRVISLPIHTEMDQEQLEYITKHILEFINH